MNHHLFAGDWHRRPPMLEGKSDLDKQVSLHMWDVNSRNGWHLDESEPMSRADRWVPWVLALATVVIVKWWI